MLPHNFLLQLILLLPVIFLKTSATDLPVRPSAYKATLSPLNPNESSDLKLPTYPDQVTQKSFTNSRLPIRGILLGRQEFCQAGWGECSDSTKCCPINDTCCGRFCCYPTEQCWSTSGSSSSSDAQCCPNNWEGCRGGGCCWPGTRCVIDLTTNKVFCQVGSSTSNDNPPPPPPPLPPAKTTTIIAITTPPPTQNACNCPPDTYCLRDPATNKPQCWSEKTYTWTYYYYYWSVTWWYTTTIYLENLNKNSIVALTTPPPPASLTGSVPPAGLPTNPTTEVDVVPTISTRKASTKGIVYPTETPTLPAFGISSSSVGVEYSWVIMFASFGTVLVCAIN